MERFHRGQIVYARAAGWRDIPGEFFKILDITDTEALLVMLGRTIKEKPGSYSRYRGIYDYTMYPLERDEKGNPFRVEIVDDKYCPFKGNFPFDVDSIQPLDDTGSISWTEDTTD